MCQTTESELDDGRMQFRSYHRYHVNHRPDQTSLQLLNLLLLGEILGMIPIEPRSQTMLVVGAS